MYMLLIKKELRCSVKRYSQKYCYHLVSKLNLFRLIFFQRAFGQLEIAGRNYTADGAIYLNADHRNQPQNLFIVFDDYQLLWVVRFPNPLLATWLLFEGLFRGDWIITLVHPTKNKKSLVLHPHNRTPSTQVPRFSSLIVHMFCRNVEIFGCLILNNAGMFCCPQLQMQFSNVSFVSVVWIYGSKVLWT